MRLLLDANIFIYREDDLIIADNIQKLSKKLSESNVQILVHPESLSELKKDKNQKRRDIMLSKIQAYSFLENPPKPGEDQTYLNLIGPDRKINDDVDNIILYAVYRDAVDFLITEDRGIHKKASKLGIDNRVLLIDDALQIFEGYQDKLVAPPALNDEFVYNINLKDPIFDSLKDEYPEFKDWFEKISRKGRKCWVHYKENGLIGAILIYKFEEGEINNTNPAFPLKKRLKICTFKVTHVGQKIGELFIKLSIELSIKNNISEIYLTHYTHEDDFLIDLISEYGFYKSATTIRNEDLYLKKLVLDQNAETMPNPIEIAKRYYPSYYDGEDVTKFVVPINPKYHNKLFTDFSRRQSTLEEYDGSFIVEGNTIKKVYISRSKTKQISQGDIILFYRSKDRRQITSLGIVEEIHPEIENSDEIIRLVTKRTVYSQKEIEDMKKPIAIILFIHHFHLKNPVKFDDLLEFDILLGPPQSITKISHDDYLKIKRLGGIDGRYTVN